MQRGLIGVGSAALAMYVWGFLFWGATSIGYSAWKASPNDAAAQQALLDHFPESGTYYVPSMAHPQEQLSSMFSRGPVAFVHVIREGRPLADPSIMIAGFVLYVAVAALLALTLAQARRPTYAGRVVHVLLVGLTAVLLVDVGGAVWWQLTPAWQLTLAVYDAAAVAVGGLVLAAFVRPTAKN